MTHIKTTGGKRTVITGVNFGPSGNTPLCPKCKGTKATMDGDTLTCLGCSHKWKPIEIKE